MPTNSFLLTQEPRWKTHGIGLKHTLPAHIQSWIYAENSLTGRLKRVYGQSLAVQILFHRKGPAFLGECRLLKVPYQRYCLIREVLLHVDDKPLILARTIIPEKTLKIAQLNLAHLGTRPLGEVIFSYPKLQKLALHTSCIKQNQWADSLISKVAIHQNIWARRRVYVIQQQPLLVNEFFMQRALDIRFNNK